MIPRVWLINVVLAAVVIFLGVKVCKVWSDGYGAFHKSAFHGGRKASRAKKRTGGAAPAQALYDVIVEKNLFSPDRAEPTAEKLKDDERDTRLPGKKIYLYGVVISDDHKSALITNPVKGKDGRKDIWVHEGDKINGLKVVEILQDSVILAKGIKEYEILLHDKNKPGTRHNKGASAGGKKPTIVAADTKKGEKGAKGRESKAGKLKERKTGKPVEEINTAEGKYRIIDTPFGKIKRRIK